MQAMIVALIAAAGSALVAVLQVRRAQREAALLRKQWEFETRVWLPNLRRDAAHSTPARQHGFSPARVSQLLHAEAEQSDRREYAVGKDAWEGDSFEPAEQQVPADQYDWAAPEMELAAEETESDSTLPPAEVPVESLTLAPFLLDHSAHIAWAVLTGGLLLASLILPWMAPGIAPLLVVLIPCATLGVAAFYPCPWAWAASAVALLHLSNVVGNYLAGDQFRAADLSFCAMVYLLNAGLVALVAGNTMHRHRKLIVMQGE